MDGDFEKTITGGETILANRYRVVRQLGQGGMGSVWLAEDTLLDGKLFAIKMLPAILVADKRAYRQMKAEALVSMRLSHPNIVTLRAFEENNGNPFLVMDYVDGRTLSDLLAERGGAGTLDEEETVKLLAPIAAALDYAHGEGVVHRDVKPANVMIRKDGHPFILDFGVAREIQETMTRVTGRSASGTLLYMSPEQLMGAQPRAAQDVYSFAAMAYECLKGEPPFLRGQVEYQILNAAPQPLPDGMLIAASVMAGLAKKPEDRPSTCAATLQRRPRPAAPPRPPVPPRPVAPPRRAPQRVYRPDLSRQPASTSRGGDRFAWWLPIAVVLTFLAVYGAVNYIYSTNREIERRKELTRRRAHEKAKREWQETADKKKAAEEDAALQRLIEERRKAAEEEVRRQERARAEEQKRKAEEAEARRREAERERAIAEERNRKAAAEAARRRKEEEAARKKEEEERRKEEEKRARDAQFAALVNNYGTVRDGDKYAPQRRAYRQTPEGVKAQEDEKPTIFLTASIDGVQKSAHVFEGLVDKDKSTPVNVTINEPLGSKSHFAVQLMEDGVLYTGVGEYIAEKGHKSMDIKMNPVRNCRHCGRALPARLQYAVCPACHTNLLR